MTSNLFYPPPMLLLIQCNYLATLVQMKFCLFGWFVSWDDTLCILSLLGFCHYSDGIFIITNWLLTNLFIITNIIINQLVWLHEGPWKNISLFLWIFYLRREHLSLNLCPLRLDWVHQSHNIHLESQSYTIPGTCLSGNSRPLISAAVHPIFGSPLLVCRPRPISVQTFVLRKYKEVCDVANVYSEINRFTAQSIGSRELHGHVVTTHFNKNNIPYNNLRYIHYNILYSLPNL